MPQCQTEYFNVNPSQHSDLHTGISVFISERYGFKMQINFPTENMSSHLFYTQYMPSSFLTYFLLFFFLSFTPLLMYDSSLGEFSFVCLFLPFFLSSFRFLISTHNSHL